MSFCYLVYYSIIYVSLSVALKPYSLRVNLSEFIKSTGCDSISAFTILNDIVAVTIDQDRTMLQVYSSGSRNTPAAANIHSSSSSELFMAS